MSEHIILPGHASDEYTGANEAGPDILQALRFREMLKELDPYLDLIWVKENAVNFPHPGRWYIVRWHPGGNVDLNTYWVVENPDGSYTPPDDRHIERLQQMDTRTRNVMEEIRQRRNDKDAARRKAFEDKRAEFRETLRERIDHLHDARISVPKAIGEVLGPDGKPIDRDKALAPKAIEA